MSSYDRERVSGTGNGRSLLDTRFTLSMRSSDEKKVMSANLRLDGELVNYCRKCAAVVAESRILFQNSVLYYIYTEPSSK